MTQNSSYQSGRVEHGVGRRQFLRRMLGGAALAAATLSWKKPGDGSAQAVQSLVPPCGPLDSTIIDAMEAVGDWHPSNGRNAKPATLTPVAGYIGQAIQLNYELATTTKEDNYAQLRRDFPAPNYRDLSRGDHIRFFHQGTRHNSLQIGLVAEDGNYFGSSWKSATHVPWWTYATWDFQDFRKNRQPFPNFSQVQAIFISVVDIDKDDKGGQGLFSDH